ncbi:2-keto-4-pentenoate hydratase [Streptomyces sp. NBC_01387]|uniref:2-keto-4-pentenoate hydratase n=1 Tax=unclassified Streptomyces TaxID=2593676 RepID=UPI0022587B41|nr:MULTISPECIES: 2-keto-4-pentenoate hydratase [unclassified Streptomyces]MCX4552815.1 2-keto-4-pentenoate hydratase [Streptomyces sp. NBC_01500]WSC24146.1 2-keto-4-pentenoate hydratase [Streptomyces sp. NBC_01766]WSV58033.1 2-keto-4-pentenoate hydratase [Streptomyces sp. NBC_01014]
MLDAAQRAEAADLLWAAQRDRSPVSPLTDSYPGIDVVDAYEIQLANIRRQLADGATVRGHKVGLSSEAMQQMMGVDEPDYGHLLSGMVLSEDVPVETGDYCYPRVEVEVGFLLGAALPGEGCTTADVLAATEYVVPSIELIDSRIKDWRIGLPDTVADNASSAGVVLGAARVRPSDLDLADIPAVLHRRGQEAARGNTGAVLGDPTTAVAWLARKVAAFGVRLEAGHLVLPGSCTRAVDVRPGDDFHAEFGGLGSVSVIFQ